MSKVCLQQQVTRVAGEVERLIEELPPHDPLRDWFFVELDALTPSQLAKTSFAR